MSIVEKISKYVFYISIVLNAILLNFLFGTVPFFLYLSVLINFALLWYIKRFLKKSTEIEEDIDDVMQKIDSFSEHVESVHSLEMYYGDENLQSLIDHSRELVNDFVDFQIKFFDVEEQIESTSEEETTEEEEQLLHEST
jgi:hypothetical protein|tara:strand:+ start:91 stop:510 length:420 start_codon:yes stop_codon:yes gene_type:complete